jgi:lysine-specific demethylase 8
MRRIPLEQRAQFSALFFLQHYLPRSALVSGAREAVRDRIARTVREGGGGRTVQVERVHSISPSEFRSRYLSTGIPVILDRAAADWTCTREWSFEAFNRRFGHETIRLVDRKGLTDDDFVRDNEYSEEIGFAAFLDQVLSGGRKYMRFSPLLEKFPELRNDFDPAFFDELTGFSLGAIHHMFIGGTGTATPFHNAITMFFFVNICGRKRWTFVPNHYLALLNPAADGFGYNHSGVRADSPDPEAFPGFECVDRLEATIGPGDVLFVPSWMWHCVENDSPTIGLRYGLYYPKSMMLESLTLFLVRLLAARNPSVLEGLYYSLVKTDLPDRENNLLIAKMFTGRRGRPSS